MHENQHWHPDCGFPTAPSALQLLPGLMAPTLPHTIVGSICQPPKIQNTRDCPHSPTILHFPFLPLCTAIACVFSLTCSIRSPALAVSPSH